MTQATQVFMKKVGLKARADLSYDVEDSDLETPKDIVINCEVFNLKEHTNISGVKHRLGLPLHSGSRCHHPHFDTSGTHGPLIIIVLVSAIPTHIVLTDTIPMAMISMTMDPVTHHRIAKVPKTTIAEAMAHHLGTQKKEVQVSFICFFCTKLGYRSLRKMTNGHDCQETPYGWSLPEILLPPSYSPRKQDRGVLCFTSPLFFSYLLPRLGTL
ncbi:hypothetical protein J1605_015877 [Eschrichtius robustus]|uniref:Uncharacterized protein n=1 Tax=Eschrichtius robustus TaxID=9764 RepID=A0AB34GA14_ESCRO|nr:hypothetical protein J1605_015877 [Eschrichtius robustus]